MNRVKSIKSDGEDVFNLMKKAAEHRLERKNRAKLLADFIYVIDSDLNVWFKRVIVNHFIDAWIDKAEDDKYGNNRYWSKSAIEQKIIDRRNDSRALNNDHLVPRVLFEDIFIDGQKLDMSKEYRLLNQKRTKKAFQFFNELKKKHLDLNKEEFLVKFFEEYFLSVTLTKTEHANLVYGRDEPDEFYESGNKWLRYKYLKEPNIGEIEIYETDFAQLKNLVIDWNTLTFEELQRKNVVKKKIIFDEYIPFN